MIDSVSVLSKISFQPYIGLRIAKVRYLDNTDKHIVIFFVTADLSNPNISLEVGTAFNKNHFNKRQTVTNMITYKNMADSSKIVIAAFNADFFSFSTNKPVGFVIKNGALIKKWPGHVNHNFLLF